MANQDPGLHYEGNTLRAGEWSTGPVPVEVTRALCEAHHYAKGCSKVHVLSEGLFNKALPTPMGVAQWLPPAPGPAKWVAKHTGCSPDKVLALSRMVIVPGVPKNAASYLLAASVRRLRAMGWGVAVTYADGLEEHTGLVYLASNWVPAGATRPRPRWVDQSGTMRSTKATVNLTVADMRARGWTRVPGLPKPRFLYAINRRYRRAVNTMKEEP